MAKLQHVMGAEKVYANIDRARESIASGVQKGITRAALYLQKASQKLTPVDTGALRASAFTRVSGTGFNTKATVGYTAAYALFVHENVQMKLKGKPRPGGRGRYWDPQGQAQAKFLETPLRTEKAKLKAIIQDGIKTEKSK